MCVADEGHVLFKRNLKSNKYKNCSVSVPENMGFYSVVNPHLGTKNVRVSLGFRLLGNPALIR